jgi:hypothetical protein
VTSDPLLPRPAVATLAALAAAVALAALPARGADVFSPGDLTKAHQALEGLQNCTKCHAAGQQLSPANCLACHTELKARVDAGKGFHGRMPAEKRECQTCHHEHMGRDEPLIDWGKGGQKAFDHERTGFSLKGKHRSVDCARCHDPRRITDPLVTAALARSPGRKTQLGQPQACSACHFDEHRGLVGADCQRCHTEDAWKPARGFDHARAAFPLTGKHARVDCAKCHAPQDQPAGAVPSTLTPPVNPGRFLKLKGLAFQRCTDCHKDPHQDRFGQTCTKCHDTEDWKKISQRAFHDQTRFPLTGAHGTVACTACHGPSPRMPVAKFRDIPFQSCADCHKDPHQNRFGQDCTRCHSTETWKRLSGQAGAAGFHDQTRFPLRGAHAAVACTACHGPFGAEPARYRGLPFGRCTDCHADAHVGQMKPLAGAAAGDVRTCDRCHGEEGYLPPRFEAADHDLTGFKLEGAHRAVACALCHVKDPALAARFPVSARADLERQKRPVRLSLARYQAVAPASCQACHRDPHGGQFDRRMQAGGGCTTCHGSGSFREVRFDHTRDASFALTGKHVQVACASCHRPDAGGVVRYAPLSFACASCHADPHAGQFSAGRGQQADCSRCHAVEAGWKELGKFVHGPPFTRFTLEGKHKALDCKKCHVEVQVAGATVRRYRPLATTCQGCHEDFHKGAFRGFVP